MDINLKSLNLVQYNEQSHSLMKHELTKGESSSEFIHLIDKRLKSSKNINASIYQSAFIVEAEGVPVGYVHVSSMVRDEVFLEYAILKKYRRMGYGSRLVSELTDYLFENHNIRSVRLDIDPSNEKSILLATSCGFIVDEEEYESRNYFGKIQFVKESNCYISKRRNEK